LREFCLDLIGYRNRKVHGIDQKLSILFGQIQSEASKKKEKGIDLMNLGTERVCPLVIAGSIEGSRPARGLAPRL
jgi:hypothetical protein